MLAVAGVASVGVPAFLMRQVGGCNGKGSFEDGAALRALVLIAERNADALRELVSDKRADALDARVMQVIERAIRGDGSAAGHEGGGG